MAEIYAPITKNQQEQTKIIKEGQENQLKAIQDQTDQIKAITLPSTSTIEPTEDQYQQLNLLNQKMNFMM